MILSALCFLGLNKLGWLIAMTLYPTLAADRLAEPFNNLSPWLAGWRGSIAVDVSVLSIIGAVESKIDLKVLRFGKALSFVDRLFPAVSRHVVCLAGRVLQFQAVCNHGNSIRHRNV